METDKDYKSSLFTKVAKRMGWGDDVYIKKTNSKYHVIREYVSSGGVQYIVKGLSEGELIAWFNGVYYATNNLNKE